MSFSVNFQLKGFAFPIKIQIWTFTTFPFTLNIERCILLHSFAKDNFHNASCIVRDHSKYHSNIRYIRTEQKCCYILNKARLPYPTSRSFLTTHRNMYISLFTHTHTHTIFSISMCTTFVFASIIVVQSTTKHSTSQSQSVQCIVHSFFIQRDLPWQRYNSLV